MRKAILAGLAVAVLVAGLVLVVRALRAGSTSGDPRAQVRLRVSVEQYRTDEVAHTVQVAMRNDGPRPVRVDQVELLAPSFDGVGPVAVHAPLPPSGLRVDVTVAYGTGRCSGDDLHPTSAPAQVALRVRTEDGKVRQVRLPLEHPNAMLDKLLGEECRQQLLHRVAQVRFGAWTVRPDGRLDGSVVVDRVQPGRALVLRDVAGSVIYQIHPAPADRPRPLGVLGAGEARLVVPIVVDVDRCTGHVLGETKKPFVFPAWVSLPDAPTIYTEIAVSDADRVVLDALVRRQCPLSR